ncbi:tripartite motif-containing protein 10-like [Pluvialis apricaria]
MKLLGLEGGREEKEHLCFWRKRMVTFKGGVKASDSSCDRPRTHRGPTTMQEEDSAQEDKEQIRGDLEKLKKQREEILGMKRSREKRCQDCLTQTEVERQKVVSEFRQMRRFLKDQELVLLARLGELEREMMRWQEEEETKTLGEISLLDVLICQLEEKLEQSASRFLQGARSAVDRYVLFHHPHLNSWGGRLPGSIPVVSGTKTDILAVQAGLEGNGNPSVCLYRADWHL